MTSLTPSRKLQQIIIITVVIIIIIITSQVCRIGGDHDKSEEPPHARHHPGRDCPDQYQS